LGNLSANRVILLFTLDFTDPLFFEFAAALLEPRASDREIANLNRGPSGQWAWIEG
jgi:hypothetical protein